MVDKWGINGGWVTRDVEILRKENELLREELEKVEKQEESVVLEVQEVPDQTPLKETLQRVSISSSPLFIHPLIHPLTQPGTTSLCMHVCVHAETRRNTSARGNVSDGNRMEKSSIRVGKVFHSRASVSRGMRSDETQIK
jgi:hypothetical protein